jgi:hypothetical protein
MPQKINMMLNNGGYTQNQLLAFQKKNAQIPQQKTTGITLNSSIIGRIHLVKPGCGSCGK